MTRENIKLESLIAVVGMGYVGLPLAVEFSKAARVIGFDVNESRIRELQDGYDSTSEVIPKDLEDASSLTLTSQPAELEKCSVFIVCVPTPIDDARRPNLNPLVSATELVAKSLSHGDVVIFESTVYPGCTEEICVPLLEANSGLKYNTDFFVGYSPERINPGDRDKSIKDIVKVTSGSNEYAAEFVDRLYSEIIEAGTFKATSIKVAEAAKVIENTQRDLNIALINELSLIFDELSIDTSEVLKAAGTKWNFMQFKPGLVGGHCIGVDPYYLTYKAEQIGYHPQVILAGRRINDSMSKQVASKLVKNMARKGIQIVDSTVLVLGITFKEDCPDTRNTKVVDVIAELAEYGVKSEVYDPWVSERDQKKMSDVQFIQSPEPQKYDAIVLAVPHRIFRQMSPTELRAFGHANHVLFDLKSVFDGALTDCRL